MENDYLLASDERPVVFSARGSHASYFEPGLYATEGTIKPAPGRTIYFFKKPRGEGP